MSENLADYKFRTQIQLRFSDLDYYGHVNNAVYLTFFETARTDYWRDVVKWDWSHNGIILARSEVNYLKPIMRNDKIACYIRTTRIGNTSFDVMHVLVKVTDQGEEICTTGKTVCISYDYSIHKPVKIPEEQRNRMIAHDEPPLILNTN